MCKGVNPYTYHNKQYGQPNGGKDFTMYQIKEYDFNRYDKQLMEVEFAETPVDPLNEMAFDDALSTLGYEWLSKEQRHAYYNNNVGILTRATDKADEVKWYTFEFEFDVVYIYEMPGLHTAW